MGIGINKAIIVGTLGKDPDVKYTAGGSAVVNVTVATNETWKDKNTGEKIEKTEWHRIVVFGKLAEICAQYLKKGSQVYFEGKIQTRKWQDQSGQDRYTTEIVANEMQMLGGRQNNTDGANQQGKPTANRQQDNPPTDQDSFNDDYGTNQDDIPFGG